MLQMASKILILTSPPALSTPRKQVPEQGIFEPMAQSQSLALAVGGGGQSGTT